MLVQKKEKIMPIFSKEQIKKMNQANPNFVDDEIYEESALKIKKLKISINEKFLDMGKVLFEFKQAYKKEGESYFKKFLNDNRVDLKPTQAEKLISIHKYRLNCGEIGIQSTDIFNKLKTEKSALIIHVKDVNLHKNLAKFVIDKKVSVDQLKYIVKDLNSDENISLTKAIDNYWKRLQMKAGLVPYDENLMPRKKTKDCYTKRNYERALAKIQCLEEQLAKRDKIIECYKKGIKPNFPKELPEVGTQKLCRKLNKAEKILEFTKANEKACIVPSLFPQILKAKENNVKEIQQKIIDKKIANRCAVLRKTPALVESLTQELISTEYAVIIGIMLIKCQTREQTQDDYITSLKSAQSSDGIISLN